MVIIDDQGPYDGRGGTDDDVIDGVKDTLAEGLEFTTSAGKFIGTVWPSAGAEHADGLVELSRIRLGP